VELELLTRLNVMIAERWMLWLIGSMLANARVELSGEYLDVPVMERAAVMPIFVIFLLLVWNSRAAFPQKSDP
jgi:uncharacterized membrane protein YecN with MAPEG domain